MDTGHRMQHVATLELFFRINLEADQKTEDKGVINLSTQFRPNRHKLALFNKGLSFVPTTTVSRTTRQALAMDLYRYHRRLKLSAYFGPQPPRDIKPFTGPSTWEPDISQLPSQLLELISQDGTSLNNLKYTPERSNLTPEEEQALKGLRKNREIIIKPADKGSAVVLMDRRDYVTEALPQLNNKEYSTQLTKPMYKETEEMIKTELEDLYKSKIITKEQHKYLLGPKPPLPRYFYLLPKIHKSSTKWTVPDHIPPGHPIVSDCGSESYRIAEYLKHFVTPLSTKHTSYIKNTQHFLSKIRTLKLEESCFLFTMDVCNLYTNIEIPLGLGAIRRMLDRHPDLNRLDDCLMRLLEISLIRNDFVFQNKFYLQVKGTAMGKRFAPAYANIYNLPEGPGRHLGYLDTLQNGF